MKRRLLMGLILLTQAWPAVNGQLMARTSHALLIGIGDYSYSETIKSLRGPANDIALVRDVLKTRFEVPENNISVLLDRQATHSALQLAFAKLAAQVEVGDFVYIHYSGHGSTCEDPSQRHGQNQTWVSYRARDERADGVDGHDVVDKEINLWLQPLYEKARAAALDNREPLDIVFVSDSCHSGTVARAIDDGVFTAVREVPPDPKACSAIAAAGESSDLPGIRIGAARDIESAIEIDTRNGGRCTDAEHCAGVFTWNWVKSLQEAQPGERWEDVFKRAFTRVTAGRFGAQRPQLEGLVQRPIFGGAFSERRPTIAVSEVDLENETVVLAAGGAGGVTKGSVYRLFDGDNRMRSDLPELVVTNITTAFSSEARIRRGQVKAGDLVTEVSHAYAFQPIRVLVAGEFAHDQDRPIIDAVHEAVNGLTGQGFELIEGESADDSAPNLLVQVLRPRKLGSAKKYERVGNHRLPASFPEEPPELWVVSPQGELLHEGMIIELADMDSGIEALTANLRRFAWAQQVRVLSAGRINPPVTAEVSLLRPSATCGQDCLFSPGDKTKAVAHAKQGVHSLTGSVPRVELNDSMTFILENTDQRASWYAYLLNISPDGKVLRIFPTKTDNEDEARLRAKERLDLSDRVWLRLNQPGVETIKLIVSRSPIDVSLLENRQGYSKRGDSNPLERLLRAAGQRRGEIETVPIREWGTAQSDYEVELE